ncbi:hypothetical protein IFR05_000505 [Cadophora sp. M221]|nr:hypothetical protein IFR05_000505 [Cadophora sp. M221]
MLKDWDVLCLVSFAWFMSRNEGGVRKLNLPPNDELLLNKLIFALRPLYPYGIISLLTCSHVKDYLQQYRSTFLHLSTGVEDLVILRTSGKGMAEKEDVWWWVNREVGLYMDDLEFMWSGYGVSVLLFMRANGSGEGGNELCGWFLVSGEDVEEYVTKYYSQEIVKASDARMVNYI